MQKWFKILILPFLILFLLAGTAMAVNITIYDGSGYPGDGQGGEIDETEPGMVRSHKWDLQAFLYEGTTLSMGGGFNFVEPAGGIYDSYTSGDIFLDIPSDLIYDYVLDVNWVGRSYEVYQLTSSEVLTDVAILPANALSNPWKYGSGGSLLVGDGSFSYEHLGSSGYSHYVTDFDLGFLEGQEFIAHFTMGCGNDNLMGSTAPVPEPATMLLLGTGLIGLAGVTRRKIYKK